MDVIVSEILLLFGELDQLTNLFLNLRSVDPVLGNLGCLGGFLFGFRGLLFYGGFLCNCLLGGHALCGSFLSRSVFRGRFFGRCFFYSFGSALFRRSSLRGRSFCSRFISRSFLFCHGREIGSGKRCGTHLAYNGSRRESAEAGLFVTKAIWSRFF